MSNTARLEGVRGFSWAPKTPYIRPSNQGPSKDLLGPHNPYEGSDSELGRITEKGLAAEWLVHTISWEDASLYRDVPVTMISLSATGERVKSILPGHIIKNHCWITAESFRDRYKHVIFIRPLVNSSSKAYVVAGNDVQSHVFAICGSQDTKRWTWLVVQRWSNSNSLPTFEPDELLIE